MAGLKLLSLLMLLSVLSALVCVEGKLVDIDPEVYHIVSKHNQERRARQAADMSEMRWDDRLARQAAQWSERCRYERPPRTMTSNSNLFYETDHVYGQKSVHRMVNSALRSWSMAQNRFSYSRHCGRACSYVQMIHSYTDAIGCALSTCEDLRSGNIVAEYASILVCFYSPRVNLLSSLPYTNGQSCSRCQRGMECRSGLCAFPGSVAVPRQYMDRVSGRRRRQLEGLIVQDTLNRNESYSLRNAHNRIRVAEYNNAAVDSLEWDPYLERWAVWVVSCEIDYPGPKHTYTNFDRLDQGNDIIDVIFMWRNEGGNTNLRMEHSCRTPGDREECNHFTNVLQPELTSMACAARDCQDNTRQLVCIYDNQQDRPARYRRPSTLGRLTYPRRVDRRRPTLRTTPPPVIRVRTRPRTNPYSVTARRQRLDQRRRYQETRQERRRRLERNEELRRRRERYEAEERERRERDRLEKERQRREKERAEMEARRRAWEEMLDDYDPNEGVQEK